MKINYPSAAAAHQIGNLTLLTVSRFSAALALLILAGVLPLTALAREATVIYLCADWGPAITLPSKAGEHVQFDDNQDEIYFLKQVIGDGVGIYLCKMKADGSAKTEIRQLWHNPNYPIDTQGQSTWMDVNRSTRKIALSITYAGSDITGLWTVNLDGGDLKRIITPDQNTNYLQAINHPSWTPDGKWIVFEEELRGMNPNQYRIVKCDPQGRTAVHLTDGPKDRQPSASPTGNQVAYLHDPMKKLGESGGDELWVAPTIWLMNIDGTAHREIPNPLAKPTWPAKGVSGTWPAWSPDGKMLYTLSAGILEVESGRVVTDRQPLLDGKRWAAEYAHWGKLGLLGSANGFRITLTDDELTRVKLLATSGVENVRSAIQGIPRKGN
ncbi:MAG TPA: hypothetical protein VL171_08530 [Verrucomicrobiae bacterium]|nr:hypothetical protein [Verrucomicrobiae bacterium]